MWLNMDCSCPYLLIDVVHIKIFLYILSFLLELHKNIRQYLSVLMGINVYTSFFLIFFLASYSTDWKGTRFQRKAILEKLKQSSYSITTTIVWFFPFKSNANYMTPIVFQKINYWYLQLIYGDTYECVDIFERPSLKEPALKDQKIHVKNS